MRYFFLALIFISPTNLHAEGKIHYKKATGEIIQIGSFGGVVAEPGEAIDDFIGDMPGKRLDFYRFNNGTLIEKNQSEKDTIENSEKKFTKARLKSYVNGGENQAEKFDRLLNVVATLGESVRESDV